MTATQRRTTVEERRRYSTGERVSRFAYVELSQDLEDSERELLEARTEIAAFREARQRDAPNSIMERQGLGNAVTEQQSLKDKRRNARKKVDDERLRIRITKARYGENPAVVAHWLTNTPGEWFEQVEAIE